MTDFCSKNFSFIQSTHSFMQREREKKIGMQNKSCFSSVLISKLNVVFRGPPPPPLLLLCIMLVLGEVVLVVVVVSAFVVV